jgi:type IV secretory pathway protease TraF
MTPDTRQLCGGATARALASRRVLLALTGAAAVVMLSAPVTAGSAQLVWNLSPSAPRGLYRIERGGWTLGDRVAVEPSKDLAVHLATRGVLQNGKLLIKRVAASAGDRVCRQQLEVSINDRVVAQAKAASSNGSLLPSWQGCITLDDAQVFLLGDTAESYDGRYFGITSSTDVVGRAVGVVTY